MTKTVDLQSAAQSPNSVSIRFSLRTFLAIIFWVCLLCALVNWFGVQFLEREFTYWLQYASRTKTFTAACFFAPAILFYIAARRFHFTLRWSVASTSLVLFGLLSLAGLGIVVWARHRIYQCMDAPQPWPYPDWAIMRLYDWCAARNPTPKGFIAIHGNWPDVEFILDCVVCGSTAITGIFCGMVTAGLPIRLNRTSTKIQKMLQSIMTIPRRGRWVTRLVIAGLVVTVLWKMESERQEFDVETKWRAAGAYADYFQGKLVGLRFIVNPLYPYPGLLHLEHFDDSDLDAIVDLTDLTSLDLSNSQITDQGLSRLSRLTNLTRLTLDGTKVTDEGIQCITAHSQLGVLNLKNTAVTDEGIGDLSKLTHLRVLDVENCPISRPALQSLNRALPGCSIYGWPVDGLPNQADN